MAFAIRQPSGRRSVAGFLDISAELLLAAFGHHYPDFVQGVAHALASEHRFGN